MLLHLSEWLKKKKSTPNAAENEGKLDCSHTAVEDVKWSGILEDYGSFL
jgi:hypothetical protein